MTILQLGAGPEMVIALDRGAIAAAALTTRYAIPFLQRGWPVLVDLSTTDLVYPSSCVTSSRAFIKAEPKTTHEFLRAYVAGIHLIKKDLRFAEKSFAKWMREKDRGHRQENRRSLRAPVQARALSCPTKASRT